MAFISLPRLLKPTCFRISLLITLLAAGVYLYSPQFLELVELKALDVRFKGRDGINPGGDVAVIGIDEQSLKELGRWPWPRSIIASLVDSLTGYGVKVISFDIVFAEESQDKAQDEALAKAVADSGRVILGYYLNFEDETPGPEGRELDGYYQVLDYMDGSHYNLPPSAVSVVGNIERISTGAAGFGYFNIIPDIDGAVRWDPLALEYNGQFYMPLSIQSIRLFLGNPPAFLSFADYGVSKLRVGDISIPVDEEGRILVNYYGNEKTFPHYSAADVMAGRIPAEKLKDRIVIIGATAVGIYDMRVTPFQETYPGVEIHATVIDNILNHRFISRPQWLALIDLAAILIVGIAIGFAVPRISPWQGLFFALSLILLFILINLYLFHLGIWINSVYPVLTMALTYPGVILYRYITEEREKKWLKGAFQYYVSADVLNELLKKPDRLKLGGEERELTVLFSDIRGFTTMSERLSPEEMVYLLNEYLTAMTDIVFEHRGYLDKYIGDAIMVVYGAPVPQEDHAMQACLTALDMMAELTRLQKKWEREGLPVINIGIGINTGPMVIGNMGSVKKKLNYTVIGDSVNLASRLEGLNKEYGTNIIISESVYDLVKDSFICRELGTVRVKGKTEYSRIYELVSKK